MRSEQMAKRSQSQRSNVNRRGQAFGVAWHAASLSHSFEQNSYTITVFKQKTAEYQQKFEIRIRSKM